MSDIITITATENTDDINIIANEVTENISIAVYENLYDGSTLNSGLTFQDGNLKLLDTDKSNTLGISLGSNLTSNRTLTLLVPDGDSTLDISSGNLTLSGNNSGDVTLAGSLDYITLSGQELTLGSINLTTDVTSVLPVASGGTGVTTATGTSSVVRQNSPILTGSPRVPTQLRGTNNTIIASTEYVNDLINNRITVSQSAPTNPEVGDAWIYLSESGYSLLSETYTTDFTEQFLLAETAEEARTVLEIGNSYLQSDDIGVTVQGYSSVLENTTASFTVADETKLDFINITGAVNLDNLGTAAFLDVGTSASQVVQLDGSGRLPAIDGSALLNLPSGFTDPMTTRGDLIYRDATNVTARLPIGTNGQVLTSDGTDVSWATPSSGTTNLGYTASPTDGTVTSDTGTDATLTLADATNAGLLAPADFTKLGYLTATGAVNLDNLGTAAFLDVGTSASQVVQLDGSARLPAVDGSQLTNLPSGGSGLTPVPVTNAQSPYTASANELLLVDTSAGAVVVNLPASGSDAIVQVSDVGGNAGTNSITINRAGSDTILSDTAMTITDDYAGAILAIDSTQTDWKVAGFNVPLGGSGGSGSGLTPVPVTNAQSPYTASANELLLVDTSTGTVVINLPGSGSDAIVQVSDVGGNAGTNSITINRNGSDTILGDTAMTVTDDYASALLSIDSTQTDWKIASFTLPNGGSSGLNNPVDTLYRSIQSVTYNDAGTSTMNNGTHDVFSLTANGGTGTTIAHSNVPITGNEYTFRLHLTWTSGSITWPTSWTKGMNAPTATGDYIIQGVTIDGGTSWTISVVYQ